MADSSTSSQPAGIFARAFRNKGTQSTSAKLTTTPPSQQQQQQQQPASPPQFPITSPPRKHRKSSSRHSISSSVTELGSSLRRSASLRTTATSPRSSQSSHRKTPSATLATLSFSPEKAPQANASRPALSISTFSRKQKSAENVKALDALAVGLGGTGTTYSKSPLSAVDQPKTPFGMAVPLRYPAGQKQPQQQQSYAQYNGQQYGGTLGPPAPLQLGPAVSGSNNPNVIFQHIHEMASKRISTLDYLRKAHEGRIYWFNTLLFSKPDLARLSYFAPPKLARRATNYLLLGFSLPTILDMHANSPTDYLRALNALLAEFESYQTIHPPDGGGPSSLSRGRIPQMFRKATHVGGAKGRRSSAATDMGFPSLTTLNSFDSNPSSGTTPPDPSTASSTSLLPDHDLLPNETYMHLLTPSLPFDPDFFETFATLCDVLIDCYTKMMQLVNSPDSASPVIGDLFAKADARVRKIILAGVVREFEDASRGGQRAEMAGVGKVVLGGLMG